MPYIVLEALSQSEYLDLFKPGRKFMVLQASMLRGMVPSGPNCEVSKNIDLVPGDVITCQGMLPNRGYSVPSVQWRDADNKPLAGQCAFLHTQSDEGGIWGGCYPSRGRVAPLYEPDEEMPTPAVAEIGLADDDEDAGWIYDADYLHELITYAMVEGGYMPDAFDGPEPADQEILAGARAALDSYLSDQDTGMPKWVLELFREVREDEPLLKSLCFYVFKNGWMSGQIFFNGRELECCRAAAEERDSAHRIHDYWKKFSPEAKKEEVPA